MSAIAQFLRYRFLLSVWILLCLASGQARALSVSPDDVRSGTLLSQAADGTLQPLPLLRNQVSIEIAGQLGRTQLVQHFKNTSKDWVEALYLFPLPQDAAVTLMKMKVGDRLIEGQIKEKQQAAASYERAKEEGKSAALVEQHRANMFSTAVANIPPEGDVWITLEYQQAVQWQDKVFSLRLPMAITPRYLPEELTHKLEGQASLSKGWSLLPQERPEALPLEPTDNTPANATSISVKLRAGFDVSSLRSLHHSVVVTKLAQDSYDVSLGLASVRADRDFVLEWVASPSQAPRAAFYSEHHQGQEYGQLSLLPPTVDNWKTPPRELIFIIDTSGSMAGESIAAARQALARGIARLGDSDTFNVIEFNSKAYQLFSNARPALDRNKRMAINFVQSLHAREGTEMKPALAMALGADIDPARMQQVVFITDGSVGNEDELFQMIHKQLGPRRLFMVGIGSAPNSYFMQESAIAGRGTYTYIGDLSEAEPVMNQLFDQIAKPALTDITIEAQGISDITPAIIPDLYAGEPLKLAMKLEPGTRRVTVRGRIGGTAWRQTIDIANVESESGLRVNWARQMIAQWQRAEFRGESADKVRHEVLQLALAHHLVSPYTSLVAVDVTPIRPQDAALHSQGVPPTRVKGLEIRLATGAAGYETQAFMALLLAMAGFFGLLMAGMLGAFRMSKTPAAVRA